MSELLIFVGRHRETGTKFEKIKKIENSLQNMLWKPVTPEVIASDKKKNGSDTLGSSSMYYPKIIKIGVCTMFLNSAENFSGKYLIFKNQNFKL